MEEAYAAYSASLLVYVRRFVRADEAEDVLKRTFLDVWRSADRFRSGERFSSRLVTTQDLRVEEPERPAALPRRRTPPPDHSQNNRLRNQPRWIRAQ